MTKWRVVAQGLMLVLLPGNGWTQSTGPGTMKRLDADVALLPYCMVQEQTSAQQGRDGLVSTSTLEITHCRDGDGRTRTENVSRSLRKQVPGGPAVPEHRSGSIVDGPHGVGMSWATNQGQPGMAQVFHFAAEAKHTEAYLQPQVAHTWANPGQVKIMVEPLGRRVIQGVVAEGVRETDEVPVGMFGNNLAYANVHETWIAVDFRVTVEVMTDDPHGSKTTTVLKSFTPGDPEASLFQVPPGYVLVDPLAAKLP